LAQYVRHPESKSLAPDGTPCKAETSGLLGRYPVTASGFHLIGKETERGWGQDDDISTLLPSLVHYETPGPESGVRFRKNSGTRHLMFWKPQLNWVGTRCAGAKG